MHIGDRQVCQAVQITALAIANVRCQVHSVWHSPDPFDWFSIDTDPVDSPPIYFDIFAERVAGAPFFEIVLFLGMIKAGYYGHLLRSKSGGDYV